MKVIRFIIILFFPLLIIGQANFSGTIKDKNNKEPLPFATIITDTDIGEFSDTKGKFNIVSKKNITELTISYIGYKTQKISLSDQKKHIAIFLEPSSENLQEVVLIATENPALKIIRNTIKNRDKNNSLKALNSFKYTLYNKLLVTANPDSIKGNIDSVFVKKNNKLVFKKLDSSNYKFKKQIGKHHLYITEKIAEHTFQRGKNKKETILASKMAGFKNPIYEFIALDIESFSFYDEVYTLLGNNYVNPLAKNALKKYDYKILDTLYNKQGPAYMVHYKFKSNEKKLGLEGLLFIHTDTYALEKAIAEIRGIVTIKAEQKFIYYPDYKIWFPDETTITVLKGKKKKNVNIFGNTIKFEGNEPENDSIVNTKQKDLTDATYLISKSKNFNIEINKSVKVINSASTIRIDDNVSNRSEEYWNKYRIYAITERGLNTYKQLDSISEAEGAERKLNSARKILKGYFPTKYFDFDLSQLINFNNHEGFRLGFGGITNPKFAKKFKLESYAAYGFKDKKLKYHLAGFVRLSKDNNSWFGIGHTNDIQEAALINFLFDETSFSLINPRNLNIGQFYSYKTYSINLEHDIFPNLETKVELKHGSYNPEFDYQFVTGSSIHSNYNLATTTLALKWTPFSKYMNTPIGKFPIQKGYPKITAQFTKSFDNVLDGNFSFNQFNLKFEHQIKFLNKSSTSFLVQGGYISGDAPLTHLYNATPNYSFNNPWRKRINFAGTNTFETMAFNEFISDRYISFQVRYNFNRFEISKKFRPRLSFISRYAIGTIDNSNQHIGVSFKKMNEGYLESGFVLNHLFRGFGLSSFYRYGAYSNPKFSDNLAVKLTYVLSLGF